MLLKTNTLCLIKQFYPIQLLIKLSRANDLFSLDYARREFATWITNGNYAFAHNIWIKRLECHPVTLVINIPFECNFQRTFGIELDIYGPSRIALLAELRDEGLNVEGEGYNHNTRGHRKIVTDSSIRGENGNEIVSPVLRGLDGIEQI